MIQTLHLRADTEADAQAKLPALLSDGAWRHAGPGWALDVIGPIDTDTRWHANLAAEPSAAELVAAVQASGLVIEVGSPRRVFAGI